MTQGDKDEQGTIPRVVWQRASYVAALLLAVLVLGLAGCQDEQVVPTTTPSPSPTASVTPLIGVDFATLAPPTIPVLQTTPTPSATPTTTPTPTPIVYQIQGGDTLWTIAATSNRSIDEILALNPGIRPEALQLGQSIILPPAPTPIFQAGGATVVPVDLVVEQSHQYRAAAGGVWVLGMVYNQASVAATNVQLVVELLDATGKVLAAANAWTAVPVAQPGGSVPFGVLIPQSPDAVANLRITVGSGESLMDAGSHYLDLAVADRNVTIDGDRILLQGSVSNQGAFEASDVLVVATLWDQQGRISGFVRHRLEGTLPPGQALPFEVESSPPGGLVTDVTYMVQGRQLIPVSDENGEG
jgi:LysM repeat protein